MPKLIKLIDLEFFKNKTETPKSESIIVKILDKARADLKVNAGFLF